MSDSSSSSSSGDSSCDRITVDCYLCGWPEPVSIAYRCLRCGDWVCDDHGLYMEPTFHDEPICCVCDPLYVFDPSGLKEHNAFRNKSLPKFDPIGVLYYQETIEHKDVYNQMNLKRLMVNDIKDRVWRYPEEISPEDFGKMNHIKKANLTKALNARCRRVDAISIMDYELEDKNRQLLLECYVDHLEFV